MHLGLKSALGLLAAYALLMAAFAVGMRRSLQEFEETVTAHAMRLLAREQAALVAERSLEALQFSDDAGRKRLRERMEDLTVLSEVVSSISLVDRDGQVLVSDDPRVGPRLASAEAVFGASREVKLETSPSPSFLGGGDYAVVLPLTEGNRLAGYLRFVLHSDRMAGMYREARRRLLATAVLGLAGLGALGLFLQWQLSRQASSITAALEGTPGPDRRRPADEFARALEAASRVRHALDEARRQASRRGLQVDALAEVFRVGVVLLRRDLEVDFVSERALTLFGAPDPAAFKARWDRLKGRLKEGLADRGQGPGGVMTLTLPEESGRRLQTELYPLGGDDSEAYLMVLSDAGLLDALEHDLRLAGQLEGMGRLYRTVAHELRAPLSAMMINLDLLRESLAVPEGQSSHRKERQERYVGVLREELDRLNRSLCAILTQAVPDARPLEFDLRSALRDISSLLAPQARRQGVELALRLPPDRELPVLGHPDRLKQAFLNVAVNGLEALPQGGSLSMEARVEGTRAWVAVRDDGPGIAPAVLSRIYDIDFSTKEGGSGIGLYVARALVELHGGEIRVESEPAVGTTVLVGLPLLSRGD